jgi:FtsX-like permease family
VNQKPIPLRSHFERPLQILMSVVVPILLVACANLANLMLARAAAREREMSVRLSLGATHRHILRQLLSESMLLSVTGALLALGLAAWAGPFAGWHGRSRICHAGVTIWHTREHENRVSLDKEHGYSVLASWPAGSNRRCWSGRSRSEKVSMPSRRNLFAVT